MGVTHNWCSSLLVRESQHRLRSDDEHAEPRDKHHSIQQGHNELLELQGTRWTGVSITLRTRSRSSSPLRHDSASDHTTALSPSPRRVPRQMHQDRRHTTSPTSLRAALPMINQSLLVGDLKLHSGELTRRLLPELCQKRSTRNPVGSAPLREPTPLQPQHSTLDVQGHCRNIRQ